MKMLLLLGVLLASQFAFSAEDVGTSANYEFTVDELTQLANRSLDLPSPKARIEFILTELKRTHGRAINENAHWTFNSVGGALAEMKVVFCSPREYLNIWGTPVGTEGHSGRYSHLDVWDIMFAGRMKSYIPGNHEFDTFLPGHAAFLPRTVARGFKTEEQTYMIDYGRGNIASAMMDGATLGHRYVTGDDQALKTITSDCLKSVFTPKK